MSGNNKAWKSWSKAFASAIVFVVAVVAYASTRDYLISQIGIYLVGVFEGIACAVLVFLFAVRYGDAINEIYLGLRELGRTRLLREEQNEKSNQEQSSPK